MLLVVQEGIPLSNNADKQKAILKELATYNKFARKFMKKRSFNYKVAYERLTKTEDWRKGKALVIEYFSLSNPVFICSVCGTELNPYASTMHHNIYDNRKLFDPKNISFLHYKCHDEHHQQKGIFAWGRKSHLRVFFGSRGMRIYIPKLGKFYIRYEICFALIMIIVMLFFFI